MVNNQVAVFIQLVLTAAVFYIDIIAGIILAAFLTHRKQDRVVIDSWTEIIVLLLHKQDAGFGSGMGFESVAV